MGVRRITDLEGGHGASKVSDLESVGLLLLESPDSDEQSVAVVEVEASVGVHGAIPMPMGMERNIRWE